MSHLYIQRIIAYTPIMILFYIQKLIAYTPTLILF